MPKRKSPLTIGRFGEDVLDALRLELGARGIDFRGSFASGQIDDYSDVDVCAKVHAELNRDFYDRVIGCLEARFGAASVRYVPDQRHNPQAQNLRISFYDLPVFWRIDLDIESSCPTERKWPDPFPEWSLRQSAFWNLVWAVKYARRGQAREQSDHYVACACEKLGRPSAFYSEDHVLALLADLEACEDTDTRLIEKLRDELEQAPRPTRRRARGDAPGASETT